MRRAQFRNPSRSNKRLRRNGSQKLMHQPVTAKLLKHVSYAMVDNDFKKSLPYAGCYGLFNFGARRKSCLM